MPFVKWGHIYFNALQTKDWIHTLYTVVCIRPSVHICLDEVFCKILKKPSIVGKKNDTSYESQGYFHWKKTKNFFFLKKNQNGQLKKSSFSSSAISQYFFANNSWIGPLVSRIDWFERHWCGSTYMVVRLSNISSKTGKKYSFGVFWLFLHLCWTASRPYRLSHTNACLRINQSY